MKMRMRGHVVWSIGNDYSNDEKGWWVYPHGEIGQWLVVLMILKKRTENELKGD